MDLHLTLGTPEGSPGSVPPLHLALGSTIPNPIAVPGMQLASTGEPGTPASVPEFSLETSSLTPCYGLAMPRLAAPLTRGTLAFETDPVFMASPAGTITVTDIGHWNTAHSWGDHSAAGYITQSVANTAYYPLNTNPSGYLTSFTETDPIFVAHAAHGITSGLISNWNTAFGWGNHATAGYQAALSGTGIVLSTAGTITYVTNNSGNWNTAFGWGNHASAGYLTTAAAAATYAPLSGGTNYIQNQTTVTQTAGFKINGTFGNGLSGAAIDGMLTTNSAALGTSAGLSKGLANFGFTTGNTVSLAIRGERHTAGSDWTTTKLSLGVSVDNSIYAPGAGILSFLATGGLYTPSPFTIANNLTVTGTGTFNGNISITNSTDWSSTVSDIRIINSSSIGATISLRSTGINGREYVLVSGSSAAGSGPGAFAVYDATSNIYVAGFDANTYRTLLIKGAGAVGTGIGFNHTAATGGRNYTLFSTGNAAAVGAGHFAIFDETASAYRMILQSDGKLLIGYTASQGAYTLQNNGAFYNNGNLVVSSTGGNVATFTGAGGTDNGAIRIVSGGNSGSTGYAQVTFSPTGTDRWNVGAAGTAEGFYGVASSFYIIDAVNSVLKLKLSTTQLDVKVPLSVTGTGTFSGNLTVGLGTTNVDITQNVGAAFDAWHYFHQAGTIRGAIGYRNSTSSMVIYAPNAPTTDALSVNRTTGLVSIANSLAVTGTGTFKYATANTLVNDGNPLLILDAPTGSTETSMRLSINGTALAAFTANAVDVALSGTGSSTLHLGYLSTGSLTFGKYNGSAYPMVLTSTALTVTGTGAFSGNVSLGNTTVTAVASPINIDLGGTISSVPGAGLKLKLLNTGSQASGLGISSGQFDYVAASSTDAHAFYIGGLKYMSLNSTGLSVTGTGTFSVSGAGDKGISVTNSTQTGDNSASFMAYNGFGDFAFLSSFSRAHSVTNVAGRGAVLATGGLAFVTNGNISSGGTSDMKFIVGGYGAASVATIASTGVTIAGTLTTSGTIRNNSTLVFSGANGTWATELQGGLRIGYIGAYGAGSLGGLLHINTSTSTNAHAIIVNNTGGPASTTFSVANTGNLTTYPSTQKTNGFASGWDNAFLGSLNVGGPGSYGAGQTTSLLGLNTNSLGGTIGYALVIGDLSASSSTSVWTAYITKAGAAWFAGTGTFGGAVSATGQSLFASSAAGGVAAKFTDNTYGTLWVGAGQNTLNSVVTTGPRVGMTNTQTLKFGVFDNATSAFTPLMWMDSGGNLSVTGTNIIQDASYPIFSIKHLSTEEFKIAIAPNYARLFAKATMIFGIGSAEYWGIVSTHSYLNSTRVVIGATSYFCEDKLQVAGNIRATGTAIIDGTLTAARFNNSYTTTPTSSSDTIGNNGDMWSDDNYIYKRTSTGTIKRVALSTF